VLRWLLLGEDRSPFGGDALLWVGALQSRGAASDFGNRRDSTTRTFRIYHRPIVREKNPGRWCWSHDCHEPTAPLDPARQRLLRSPGRARRAQPPPGPGSFPDLWSTAVRRRSLPRGVDLSGGMEYT